MNKIFIAACSAFVASAYQMAEPKFLQTEEIQEPIRASSTSACQFMENYSWYNYISTGSAVNLYSSDDSSTGQKAYFTYCQDLTNTGSSAACATGSYYASVYDKDGNCALNASTITSTQTNDADGNEVFTLVYTNDDTTSNGGIANMYVQQNCDANSDTVTTTQLLDLSDGNVETTQTSSYACPVFTMNAFIQFVDQYAWMFGTGFIVIGLFLAFLGRKLFNVAVFIVTTMIVTGLILFIFYATFLESNTEAWVSWTVLALSILLGLVCGFFMVKLEKFAGALLAGFGGFCLGVVLNETCLYLAQSAVLFWCVNIGLAIIFAILGFVVFDHAIIMATAFLGSYMTMRGIGIMAGGFPNEYVLINEIESGAIDNIDPVFYAYLAGIFVMTIIAAIVQFKMFKKQKEEESHPYAQLN